MRFPTAGSLALLVAALLVASLGATVLSAGAVPTGGVSSPAAVPSDAPTDRTVGSSASGAAPAIGLAPSASTAATACPPALSSAADPDADVADGDADPGQVIVVETAADGNATWTIEHRFRLDSEADIDDFHEYAVAVAEGDRSLEGGYDEDAFRPFADLAARETDREMAIVDAGWAEPTVDPANESAADPDVWVGTVSYSFTWTNFASAEDGRVVLGDVFAIDGEPWFPELTDRQCLEVHAPPDYDWEDSPGAITRGALVWTGPHEFEAGEIHATWLEGEPGNGNGNGNETENGNGTVTDTATPTDTPTSGSLLGDVDGSSWALTGLGLLVVLALVALGGYAIAGRDSDDGSPFGGWIASAGGDDGADRAADAEAAEPIAGAEDGPPAADEPETAATDGPADGDPGTADATTVAYDEDVDVDLLSDEERVLRLLRRNGGRMKQASIVSETGWSNAKVSQLLSEMDEADDIEKLRIGRENLITLPDVDPTEID